MADKTEKTLYTINKKKGMAIRLTGRNPMTEFNGYLKDLGYVVVEKAEFESFTMTLVAKVAYTAPDK